MNPIAFTYFNGNGYNGLSKMGVIPNLEPNHTLWFPG